MSPPPAVPLFPPLVPTGPAQRLYLYGDDPTMPKPAKPARKRLWRWLRLFPHRLVHELELAMEAL